MTGEYVELNRLLDKVNYEAQQIIVDGDMSESRKDFELGRKIEEIRKIGEERARYVGGTKDSTTTV